jgi:hypothetical protein
MTRLGATIVVLAMSLAGGVASADVILRVQVLEEKAGDPAARAPADAPADPPKVDAILTMETLAPVGGSFLARTSVGKQKIELKGKVKQNNANDPYRVSVNFSDAAEGTGQQVATTVELRLDQPHVIAKSGGRSIVLTICNEPAK